MDKNALEALVRQVLLEKLGGGAHGVRAVRVPDLPVSEEHRMDTGDPRHRVYTRDLFSLQESPRLGAGIMEMTDTTFPWTLRYDEMDYVISGRLDVLIGGERVPKYDVRVEAYGSIDELSAQTAMLRDMLNGEDVTQFDDDLIVISRLLMHTESLMALGHGSEDKVKDLNGADIGFLEKRIDEISAVLPPIERFTLPGGHIVVSQAHICRTVCRRAERQACRAAAQYPVSSNALMFLNRLSDYFYVLGRRLAMLLGAEEILWEP